MRHKQRGFTLIELLVVIAVLGILAVLAVPAYKGWIKNAQYKEAARNVVSILRNARARAIEQNVDYRVEFDLRDKDTADPPVYRLIKWDTVGGTWSITAELSGNFSQVGLFAGADTDSDGLFSDETCGDNNTTQSLVFRSNGSIKTNMSSTVTSGDTVQFFCVLDDDDAVQSRVGVTSLVTGRIVIE